jgi:tetratricopeptide (TPR) repeat protein
MKFEGRQVSKMFLAAGEYEVRYTVTDSDGRAATALRPLRVFAVDNLENREQDFLVYSFCELLNSMPLDQLRREEALIGARLLREQGFYGGAAKILTALVERHWAEKKEVDSESAIRVAELLADALSKPQEAADFCRRQLERIKNQPAAAAALNLWLGRVLAGPLGQPDAALAALTKALADCGSTDKALRREILIALGDARLNLGEIDPAREALQEAQTLPPPEKTKAFDISSAALTVEAYLREDRLDEAEEEINKWLEIYPLERLSGYATILQSRLLAKREQLEPAARALEIFLKSDPKGTFEQVAMEQLADLYVKLARPDDARKMYESVLAGFQDPRLQDRVKRKLDRL